MLRALLFGAMALSLLGCADLTRPNEIAIVAEPIQLRTPPALPAPPPVEEDAEPAAAPARPPARAGTG